MASQTSDRQRMSNDLRELAKLATKSETGRPAPHRFEATTESSGFFDLSALLASEAARAERERAPALRGAPPPLPRIAGRPFDIPAFEVPSHERLAPAAFEALGDAEEMPTGRSSGGRKALYALLSLASVGLVGYLAFTLAQHPPPPAAAAPASPAVAAAPAPTTDPAPQPPATAAVAAPTAAVPVVPDADSTASTATAAAATPAPSTKRAAPVQAARVHVAAGASPTPGPARAAAAHPAVIPASHPAPAGNDSLMDLIKKSVATGK